jgi:hypothetical protein
MRVASTSVPASSALGSIPGASTCDDVYLHQNEGKKRRLETNPVAHVEYVKQPVLAEAQATGEPRHAHVAK